MGLGYTKKLDDFRNYVRQDLFSSINKAYSDPEEITDELERVKIQHENAVKLKAINFVGRTNYVDEMLDFCVKDQDKSVYILHGVPGAGKSGPWFHNFC